MTQSWASFAPVTAARASKMVGASILRLPEARRPAASAIAWAVLRFGLPARCFLGGGCRVALTVSSAFLWTTGSQRPVLAPEQRTAGKRAMAGAGRPKLEIGGVGEARVGRARRPASPSRLPRR